MWSRGAVGMSIGRRSRLPMTIAYEAVKKMNQAKMPRAVVRSGVRLRRVEANAKASFHPRHPHIKCKG